MLSDFSNMLRLSGYSEDFRLNTINGVLLRWREVLNQVDQGNRLLHRPQNMIAEQKRARGGNNTATWFLKGEVTNTLKVPYTPSGTLRNNVQKALNSIRGPDGGYTKVVETAGTTVSHLVTTKTETGCSYVTKCLVSDESNCQTPNVNYEAICSDCPPPSGSTTNPPSLYIGTTGSNIHHRSLLHVSDKKSSLHTHNKDHHSESVSDFSRFKFTKTDTYQGVLPRIMSEAFKIAHSSNRLMNSKKEYGAGKWISLNPTKFNT